MELRTTGKRLVEEVEYGIWVWELPSGEILGDGDGNVMNCFVMERKDREAGRQAIAGAAKHYGFPEGKAVWWSGHRPINDEQLAEQTERALNGLTPDPFDLPAIRDEMRSLEQNK